MKRTLSLVLILAAILFAGTWAWMRRPAPAEDGQRQQGSASWHQQRLQQLRASLEQVKSAYLNAGEQPPAAEIEARIRLLKDRIAETKSQLQTLGADRQALAVSAAEAKAEKTLSLQERIGDLEKQLEIIVAQMAQVDAQIQKLNRKTESEAEDVSTSIEDAQAEYQALSLMRDQLKQQILEAKNNPNRSLAAYKELQAGESEISADAQPLRQQLEDLRADLEYWENAKAERSPDLRQARIAELEAKIHALEERQTN